MGKTTFIDGNKTIIDTDYYIKLLGCESKNKELQSRINSLEKRLRHLLESDTISLFDEVNSKTLEYKYDISIFDKDYTSIMFATIVKENKELNKKLDKCISTSESVESIRRKNERIAKIQQENEELKKQLNASRRVAKHHLNRELDLESCQKEFINYLEKEIVDCKAGSGQQYYYSNILKFYKKIIGVKE